MVQLHYDKNEIRLIAKKGRGLKTDKERIKIPTSSSGRFSSHSKSKGLSKRSKAIQPIKGNVAYSTSDKKYSNAKNSSHVVVKITGGAKTAERCRGHLNYITRNDELPLFNENGNVISLKQAKSETDLVFDELCNLRADARRYYNIAFSRQGKTDPTLLLDIVKETINLEFPNKTFYCAVHEDTDNTHVHVVLCRKGETRQSKLLEINKKKLNELKKTFANIQNKYGLEAVFLSETDKNKNRKSTLKNTPERSDKRKGANEYIVLDFGKAKYEFKENGKPSFYILLQTKNNEKKLHWSLGLQTELKNKSVRIGDKIKLKKVNTLDTEQVTSSGQFKKSSWDITVLEQSQNLPSEQFKMLDYGKAPYKFDDKGKPSYYMLVENHKGEVKDYWGKAIEAMLIKNGIKQGDIVIRDSNDMKAFIKVNKVTQVVSPTQPKIENGMMI